MASNAIRAKARLPWLLLAAFHRNTHTRDRRGVGASSTSSAGTAESRLPAPSCACYERAFSALRYVAWGRPLECCVECVRNWVELETLASGTLGFGERIPARVSHRRTITRSRIQVGTASRAQTFAIFATECEAWRREEPKLPHGRSEIELARARVKPVDIRIVGLFVS